jgi:hypothetical protein
VSDVKSVLAALSEDGKSAPAGQGSEAPATSKNTDDSTGKTEATPGQPAADEEPPGAKSSEPARPAPASLRLLTGLAELTAEAEALT